MRYIYKAVLVIMFLSLGSFANADESSLTALSVWKNQRGSALVINTIDPSTGTMTGSYINNAAGFGCIGTPYPVTGYVYQNLISWSVNWNNAYANCQSITGWTGYYANGQITTNWELVSGTQISQGSDIFTSAAKQTLEGLKLSQ